VALREAAHPDVVVGSFGGVAHGGIGLEINVNPQAN
jgi:hypothetical protein